MKTIISLDFDGVLHRYDNDFISNEIISSPPVVGSSEWCWRVWNSGKADLVISSGRCSTEAGIQAIKKWLKDWDFPPIPVSPVKPVAHVYIDDRAYKFEGNWFDLDLEFFIKFRAWWDQ